MADTPGILIRVAHALPAVQWEIELQVAAGTTARVALAAPELRARLVDVDVQACPIGVYGREVRDDYVLRPGDRLEIYRPLPNDPRLARRTAAAQARQGGPSLSPGGPGSRRG